MTYAEASLRLETQLSSHPTVVAGLSGALAGGAQALIAAPAENLRLSLEGGNYQASWSKAWREVFWGNGAHTAASGQPLKVRDARHLMTWMQEIGAMAGRGWHGWRLGIVKEVVGRLLNLDN